MSAPPAPKILRVGVIQGGKIIEERHLKTRTDVTVGPDAGNTFVIPSQEGFPSTFSLFEFRASQYHLVFTEPMQGRLRVGTADVDFESLKSQGAAHKRGDVYVLPLTDAAKGKVTVGEVTLLFQFVVPPPEPIKPELPEIAKGSLWQSMDRVFFTILALSLVLHFSGATFIYLTPKPVETELALDQLPDRFAKVLIPVKLPEPDKVKPKTPPPPEEVKPPDEKEPEAAPVPEEVKKPVVAAAPVADRAQRRADLQQKVASKGLLRILGSQGGTGTGAFQDVLGTSTGTGDIASALQGAGGVGVATTDAIGAGGRKGAGTGNVAAIGDLGTSGGGNVNLGTKGDAAVVGRVKDESPVVDTADIDRAALARYVKARLKAIQNCYERELKRNPKLKGKVVVRFSITRAGRTSDIEIEEDTLGDEAVASCIRTVMRGWVFPFKPDDEVPVAYPFVFSPAS
jgi:outer membrane biosynthesis protein TonB